MNATKTVISVRTDKGVKKRAQQVAGQFGIPLSTLINAFLHELADTGQVYFTTVEVMSPEVEREVALAEKEIKAGEVSPAFETAEEAMRYLNSK